jgi:hypothetical protein
MFRSSRINHFIIVSLAGLLLAVSYASAQQGERGQSSYMPVDIAESFASLMTRLSAAKPGVEREHSALLNERYDLSDRPAQGVTMEEQNRCKRGSASNCRLASLGKVWRR